jgi:PBP1b-binding outer membrane lipoprotein LpoB
MRKIAAITLAALLLAGCAKREPAPAPAPLQLHADEVEFWQRLMERDFQKPGMKHWERSALEADEVILELRKRNGRY